MTTCDLTLPQVTEAFLAAPPLLSKNIYNFTVRSPRWLRDLWELEEFPLGQGTTMQQLIIRGQMPQIERGFAAWKQLNNNSGCNPCEGPDCSYNITPFGGTGIEVKAMNLMSRDFQSPTYCIKQIQTTAHFEQIFSQIVLNLYMQIDFFKEQNIGFNYLTSLAKKLVCDSDGLKPNKENPYVYRPKGTATLSALNIEGLTQIYEWMRLQPTAVPYDVVNGSPIFALECSMELISRLYRDDPQLRQDVRFSGYANNLVNDYNFMSTIRGMFIVAPILYPRRFRYDGDNSQWLEVLPFINGVPANVGAYTDINGDYIDPSVATHEEVLMHGKHPFKIMYLPTEITLGHNTSFGPEFNFMNAWTWVNPLTPTDPARREGFFFTSATIGLSPQYSESIYGWLVERPSKALAFSQNPQAACPVSPPTCTNSVPDVGCPCSLILDAFTNPVSGDTILTLAVPLAPVPSPSDTIQFGIDTGGYLVGTVVDAAADGLSVEVTFPNGTDLGICDHFTSIFCDNTMGCSALVQAQCVAGTTSITVTLGNAIKAVDNNDDVVVTYADGTTETVQLVGAANLSTLQWTLDGFDDAFTPGTCAVPTIVSVCVPTATDSSCPGCGGPSATQCTT
jgi:hypothetical protein